MSEIRLQKYFTDCGIMSRRAAEREIEAGRVLVNSAPAALGTKIDPSVDTVEYNGKIISDNSRGHSRGTYILLNKPIGYVTTTSDEKGRLTVLDLVKDVSCRVYPVGRLDMYSDGLLIMTNDGALTNRLTHPSHGISKTYIAEIPMNITEDDVERLRTPFEIDGRMIRSPQVKIIDSKNGKRPLSHIEIVLCEGRNRQIRRMCERAGFKLTRLTRVKIGDIRIGNLPLGKWRYLTEDEIKYLMET